MFISHFTKFLSFCIFPRVFNLEFGLRSFCSRFVKFYSHCEIISSFDLSFWIFKFAQFDLFHIPACSRIWNYFHTQFDFLESTSFEFLDSRFEFEFKFSRVCDFYIVGCSRKRKKEKEAKRKKENIIFNKFIIYYLLKYLDIYLKFNLRN